MHYPRVFPVLRGLNPCALIQTHSPRIHSISRVDDALNRGMHVYKQNIRHVGESETRSDYNPTFFTHPLVFSAFDRCGIQMADPPNPRDVKTWPVSYASPSGSISFDDRGYPINPRGRTGMWGRARMYRWGPNRHESAIVTRFNEASHRFEFAGVWEMPFSDLHDLGASTKNVFKGYIDTSMNTDNAWIEGDATHFRFVNDSRKLDRLFNWKPLAAVSLIQGYDRVILDMIIGDLHQSSTGKVTMESTVPEHDIRDDDTQAHTAP